MSRQPTNKDRKPWTLYLSPEHKKKMAAIRKRYGLSDDSSAVRMAIEIVFESPVNTAAKKKIANSPPKPRGRVSNQAAKAKAKA